MKNEKTLGQKVCVLLIVFLIMWILGAGYYVLKMQECSVDGCNQRALDDSDLCSEHAKELREEQRKEAEENEFELEQELEKYREQSENNSTNTYSSPSIPNRGIYKRPSMDSYDEGYEDVYLNDDYDWDRYQENDDYAMGVDDALDDEGDDW